MNMDFILRGKGRDVVTIDEARTLQEAANLMDSHGIGALLVCDNHERPVGVLSERDVIREVALNGAASLTRPTTSAILPATLARRGWRAGRGNRFDWRSCESENRHGRSRNRGPAKVYPRMIHLLQRSNP